MRNGQVWQAFILLHALFSALQTLQFRAIARTKAARHAGLAVNAVAFSGLYICGLLALPLIGTVHLSEFTAFWQPFALSAFLFVLPLFYFYKAAIWLESATLSVLLTSSALFGLILGWFVFDERLSPPQAVGSAVLLGCIWYVVLLARRNKGMPNFHNLAWLQGGAYAIAASFCLALAHIIEKDLVNNVAIGTYVAYGWLLQAGFAWLLYLIFGQKSKQIFKNAAVIRMSMQLGGLRFATGIFFIYALVRSNSVSLMMVIANFRIIIVAILAGWLLNERRYYYQKLAAAAISLVGLSIIFWN